MSPLEYLEQAWKTTTIYQFNSILTAFKMVQGKKIAKLEQELGIVKSESTTETGLGQFTAEISGTTPDIIRTLGTIGNRNIENGSVIIDKDWIGTAKRQIQAMIEQDALSVETLEACLTHLHPAVRLGALRTIYKLKPETIRGVPTLDFLLEMYTKDQDGWLTIPLLKAIIVAQKARIEELLAIRDAG